MIDNTVITDKDCDAAKLTGGKVTPYRDKATKGLFLVLTPRSDETHTASWVLRL
jgi:hypothetical protein